MAVALGGMICITVLAATRVIPPDQWKWTLGGIIGCAFPGYILKRLPLLRK